MTSQQFLRNAISGDLDGLLENNTIKDFRRQIYELKCTLMPSSKAYRYTSVNFLNIPKCQGNATIE